jgi:hypothetical protein
MDEHNERWLELATHPNRKRENNNPEPFEQMIEEQHELFKNNPKTYFYRLLILVGLQTI